MSFDLVEVSRFLGRPVHLFMFTRQSQVWRFASGGRDVVVGGHTYVGAQIGRSEIQQTIEREKDKLTITFPYLLDPAAPEYPATQALGNNWRPYIPSSPVSVICMAAHIGDASAPAIEWMGVVTEVAHTDTKMTLTCEPSNGSSQARNQGAKWQRGCWKTVYSTGLRGCNLDPENFKIEAVLSAVNELTLTAAEFGASAFNLAGGSLTWTNEDGLIERRSIMAHSGDNITLLYGSSDLAGGLAVVALPGCPRTWVACEARENTPNYGGAIYKPGKSPIEDSMSWG